ncbi:MAG: PAS domain-containing protein [Ignavibacteriales bacterium]|nr:MAG: PAS domain-containing protein [Ignavibacteriales bacterium]
MLAVETIKNPFSNVLGNIKDSFIVLDMKGNILSFNKSAASLFFLPETPGNFLDYLNPETAEDINSLLLNIKEQKDLPISASLHMHLKSGSEFNCTAILNLYSEESEDFVLCTFLPEENIIQFKNRSELKIKTENILSLISNKEVLSILDEIRTHFPFTFVGREKIRRQIDKLDEYVVIKDKTGIILLANKKYLNNLSLNAKQVEGKNENFFIPSYLNTLYESVNRYVVDSGNCFTTEGIPYPVFQQEGYQNILIPLSDSGNRVAAIISLTQEIKPEAGSGNKSATSQVQTALDEIPLAVLVTDRTGMIRNVNADFCNLFSINVSNITKETLATLISKRFHDSFAEFVNGTEFEITFNYKFRSVNADSEEKIFIKNVKIKRQKNNSGEEAFWFFFSEADREDDLEKLIKRRGRMFEVLIQKNPEPVFVYDKENLRFLEVNDAALQLYGYSREEFLQMDLTDLYTHEDIQTLLDSSSSAMKEGVFHGPFRHKKKDGTSVFVEISKTSFSFSGKDAHFNIIRDVTRRLDLELQSQLFKSAFDNSNDLIFITDSTGFITFTNQAVTRQLGYTKDDLLKSSFTAIVINDERGTVNKQIFQAGLKKTETISANLKSKKGDSVEIILAATPVFNYRNEIESYNIVGSKIQEFKTGSADEIKSVSPESGIATDSVFLSSLFHEILTPMNVILGFVRELTESMEVMTPEQKEAAEIIDQNRSSLLSTMNLIIEYTNIQRNNFEFNPEELSITQIIDGLQQELSAITQSRGIELAFGKISNSLKFTNDKQKFQILLSLLVKIVTRLSKEKKIYLSAYQHNEDSFIVVVKDNYSEISDVLSQSLSSLFQGEESLIIKDFGIPKLNSRLAKILLTMLGGKFAAFESDTENYECGFTFPLLHTAAVLPAKDEKPVKVKDAVADEPVQFDESFDTKNYRSNISTKHSDDLNTEEKEFSETIVGTIEKDNKYNKLSTVDLSQLSCLYIEDQVDSQILFKVQLKELREIKFAVSFEEALPLLDQHHFDFIVMDINLQGEYNGLDALKIIHKMPQYETIPIIAVTAYVLPGDREKFITVGFNDFISKPIFRDKMLESLEKIF